MTVANAAARNFNLEESSAIAFVSLENAPQVDIAFQSNPAKVYSFQGSESVIEELEGFINTSEVQGLGSFVAVARRLGELQEV